MRIAGGAHDARSGFRGPRHVRRRYPWNFQVRERLMWVVSLCVALIMRRAAARVATFSARVSSVEQFVTAPVVEIAFPPHDHVHAANDISIEIALRRELLRQPRRHHHHVCVGMETLAVPEDVPFDDASGRPTEHCYLANEEPTSTYAITGLLPGARYSVSVALVHGGDQVVGLSMRSFQVASITRVTDTNEVVRMSIADALRMARDLHLNDDRTGAVVIYREVLKMFPHHAEALHRLGQAQYQDGQALRAVELIRQAIDIDASDATMYVSLALCLKALGRTDDAVAAFRTALVLRPSYAYAAMGLGSMLQAMDKWDEALHEFRKVVSTWKDPSSMDRQILEPPHEGMVVEALAWVCEILRLTDGLYEAERCLSHATKGFPNEVRFHIDRGHLLLYGGQFESAKREYEAASRLGSVHAMTHVADVLEAMGEYDASIRRYQEVLESPLSKSLTVHSQVAIMLTTVLPRILPASQEAIDLERERFRDSVASVLRHLEQDQSVILIDPSRIAFSTGISMNAHNRNNRELKRLLGKMYSMLWVDQGIVREEYVNSYGVTPIPYHQQFQHEPPIRHARLRVGFVSRFLYNTGVGLFMNELLPQLNATKYELYAFGIGLSKSVKGYDQVPQIAEHVVALPRDLRLAREEIRAHNVDLLIYPELGMDKTTYFVSYHRLAPVQAAWWGNPDTTGVPTIDYFISSDYEHKDARDHYTETLYQMKGLGIYHTLPPLPNSTITREDVRRTVQERFELASDFRFYLSIESMLHLHPDFDEAIRLILTRDPLAHVFLLSSSNRKSWKHQLQSRIEAHIGPQLTDRVLFFTDVDTRQEILLLGAADAVLASLHVTRAKAAMQAFTAGVPVVTLVGTLWATRVTSAFYKQMGVRGLTATSLDEYVTLAVRLATDDSFRDRMTRKIRRNRERLSRDRVAVAEWEMFFDVAAARLQEGGADNKVQQTEPVHTERDKEAVIVDMAMTCPATSLLDLL